MSSGFGSVRVLAMQGVGRGVGLIQCSGIEQLCHGCWRGLLAVSSDGTCYPCVFARNFPVGNVFGTSLGEIVSSQELRGFRGQSFAIYQQRYGAGCAEPAHDARDLGRKK